MTPRDVADYEELVASIRWRAENEGLAVYEVWWEANTRYPDAPLSFRLAVAEAVVTDLLRAGSIRLMAGPWIGWEQGRTAVERPSAVLREWATWVTQEDPLIWIDSVR